MPMPPMTPASQAEQEHGDDAGGRWSEARAEEERDGQHRQPDSGKVETGLDRVRRQVAGRRQRRAELNRGRDERVDRRRLPRTVGAEEPEDLSLADLKLQAVERECVPVALGEAVGLDRSRSHATRLRFLLT